MDNKDIVGALLGVALLAAALYMYFKEQEKAEQEQAESSGGTEPDTATQPGGTSQDNIDESGSVGGTSGTGPTKVSEEVTITKVSAPYRVKAGADFKIKIEGTNLEGKKLRVVTSASEIYGYSEVFTAPSNSFSYTVKFSKIDISRYPLTMKNYPLEWKAGFAIIYNGKVLKRFYVMVDPDPYMTAVHTASRITDVSVDAHYDYSLGKVYLNVIQLIFDKIGFDKTVYIRTNSGTLQYQFSSVEARVYPEGFGFMKPKTNWVKKTVDDLRNNPSLLLSVKRAINSSVVYIEVKYNFRRPGFAGEEELFKHYIRLDFSKLKSSGVVIVDNIHTIKVQEIIEPEEYVEKRSEYLEKYIMSEISKYIKLFDIEVYRANENYVTGRVVINYDPTVKYSGKERVAYPTVYSYTPESFYGTVYLTLEAETDAMQKEVIKKKMIYTGIINSGTNEFEFRLDSFDVDVPGGITATLMAELYYADTNTRLSYASKDVILSSAESGGGGRGAGDFEKIY